LLRNCPQRQLHDVPDIQRMGTDRKEVSSGVKEDKLTNWMSIFTFQEDRLGFEVMSS
jgi:hypothetical protein